MKLGTLISVKQLGEALAKFPKNLRVLDSSWHPPAAERDPYAEFIEGHIPGALFFDLEECRDKSSKYDHMLPSPSDFEDYVGHLGINNDTHVVVYENDATGFYSSPRAWWNFRVFGHHSVSILNGGFPRWIAEGRPVTKELHSVKKEIFKAQFNEKLVTSLGTVLENKKDEKFQLVDARSANRYNGIEDEPSGIPGGNIPGTSNIPFKKFMTKNEDSPFQTLRSEDEIKQIFKENKVDLSRPMTATCGAGMTACTLALAAFQIGKTDVPVYDGSWMEYYDKLVKIREE